MLQVHERIVGRTRRPVYNPEQAEIPDVNIEVYVGAWKWMTGQSAAMEGLAVTGKPGSCHLHEDGLQFQTVHVLFPVMDRYKSLLGLQCHREVVMFGSFNKF